jgi:UDP-N-acetyl-D-galactosamine dehydrogenase
MASYVVDEVTKLMIKKNIDIDRANILVMGLTFKENCPDIRNTKIIDLVTKFKNLNCNVDVHDPWVSDGEAQSEYKIKIIKNPNKGKYDVVILAVAHDIFKNLKIDEVKSFGKDNHIIYDVKHIYNSNIVDGRL